MALTVTAPRSDRSRATWGTESAAGAVGLIKAVLSLRHGVVPPMVHFPGLPDDLARIDTKLFVPQSITPWPTNGHKSPRRVAVSSYGMSGTNMHGDRRIGLAVRGRRLGGRSSRYRANGPSRADAGQGAVAGGRGRDRRRQSAQ